MKHHIIKSLLIGLMLLTQVKAQADCGDLSTAIKTAATAHKAKDFDNALSIIKTALSQFEAEGTEADSCRYRAYRFIARTYKSMWLMEESLEAYQQAATFSANSLGKTHYRTAFLYGAIGSIYEQLADFESARRYLEQEIEVLTVSPPPKEFDMGIAQYNLARMYFNLGMYDKSEDLFLGALPHWIQRFGETDTKLKWIYNSLGAIYWELEEQEQALYYYQQALKIDMANNKDAKPLSWVKGDEALGTGKFDKALTYYQQELANRNRIYGSDHPLTAGCYNYIANTLRYQHKNRQALENYQQAIIGYVGNFEDTSIYPLPKKLGKVTSEQWLLDALQGKAELFHQIYQEEGEQEALEAAFAHCEFASQIVDRLRMRMQAQDSRVFWTRKVRPIYQLAMAITYELYAQAGDERYLQAAFHFSEKSKAFLLLQALREGEAQTYAGVPDTVLKEEKALRKEMADNEHFLMLEQQNCEASDTLKVRLIQDQIFELRKKLLIWTQTLAAKYPNYYQLKYQAQQGDLEQWQAQCQAPQTAVLNYMETDSFLYVLALAQGQGKLWQFPWRDTEKKKLAIWRKSLYHIEYIRNHPQESYHALTKQGFALYQHILAPVDAWLQQSGDIDRLVIIADGQLSYVPFEVLLTENTESRARDYTGLPYLLHRYSISYAQAAQALLTEKQQSPKTKYMGFAPFDADVEAGELPNLTFNREEVELAATFWEGKSYLNEGAQKSAFEAKSPQAGILHLAMHAVVNDSSPQYSYLKFSDDLLYTYELYSQRLSAQLVVLSACNTGSGKLIEGEGVISLARAFQYAGCPAVAMSMWQVDDRTTASLTTAFFHKLAEGLPKDQALQQAKLAYLAEAEPAFAHPFYWAGINLIGDRAPLEKGKSSFWIWAIVLLLGLGFFLVLTRAPALRRGKE